ncbi:hypothetical protein V6N13_035722 [Hibiscus sabdariffa]
MFMKNNHPFFRKPPPSTEAAVFLSLRPPSPNSDRSLRPPETQKTFFLKPSSFNFLTILLTATSLEGVLSLSESLGRQQTADLNVFEGWNTHGPRLHYHVIHNNYQWRQGTHQLFHWHVFGSNGPDGNGKKSAPSCFIETLPRDLDD